MVDSSNTMAAAIYPKFLILVGILALFFSLAGFKFDIGAFTSFGVVSRQNYGVVFKKTGEKIIGNYKVKNVEIAVRYDIDHNDLDLKLGLSNLQNQRPDLADVIDSLNKKISELQEKLKEMFPNAISAKSDFQRKVFDFVDARETYARHFQRIESYLSPLNSVSVRGQPIPSTMNNLNEINVETLKTYADEAVLAAQQQVEDLWALKQGVISERLVNGGTLVNVLGRVERELQNSDHELSLITGELTWYYENGFNVTYLQYSREYLYLKLTIPFHNRLKSPLLDVYLSSVTPVPFDTNLLVGADGYTYLDDIAEVFLVNDKGLDIALVEATREQFLKCKKSHRTSQGVIWCNALTARPDPTNSCSYAIFKDDTHSVWEHCDFKYSTESYFSQPKTEVLTVIQGLYILTTDALTSRLVCEDKEDEILLNLPYSLIVVPCGCVWQVRYLTLSPNPLCVERGVKEALDEEGLIKYTLNLGLHALLKMPIRPSINGNNVLPYPLAISMSSLRTALILMKDGSLSEETLTSLFNQELT